MLSEVTGRADYTANGSVYDFNFLFPLFTKQGIEVLLDGVVQTLDTHYQVRSGSLPFDSLPSSSLPATGFVRFVDAQGLASPPASGAKVALLRKQTLEQVSHYLTNQAFPGPSVEKDFDKLIMVVQMLQETLTRCLRLPKRSNGVGGELPFESYASKFFRFNAAGTALEMVTGVASLGSLTLPVAPGDGGTGRALAGVTKGDLLAADGGNFNRVPVGSDGQALLADSAQTAGVAWGDVVRSFDRSLTVVEIVNDNTEQTVYSVNVPGGTLGTSRGLRLILIGDYLNNSGGGVTFAVRGKYGGTTFAGINLGSLAITANAARRSLRFVFELSAAGATGSQVSSAVWRVGDAGSADGDIVGGTANGDFGSQSVAHNAGAVDSSVNQTLAVTFQHQTAAATISARKLAVRVELIP